jgi:hypothetical protein
MNTSENSKLSTLFLKVENNPRLAPLYNAEVELEKAYNLPLVERIRPLEEQISNLEIFFPNIRHRVPRRFRYFENVVKAITTLYTINQNQYEQQH